MSNSYSGWNDVGFEQQKCLSYYRDMYHTLETNDDSEFKSFFKSLHSIFKDAIKLWTRYQMIRWYQNPLYKSCKTG